jgi:hypothetical protein
MSKLNLFEWDILNRVYFCLYGRQDNYRVVVINLNDLLERITITNEMGDQLFSIEHSLNIDIYDPNINRENIIKCFADNGIHAT